MPFSILLEPMRTEFMVRSFKLPSNMRTRPPGGSRGGRFRRFGIQLRTGNFLLLAFATLLAGCSHKAPEKAAEAPIEKAPESRVKHGTNDEVIVTLDADTQKLMGLQTA